MSARFLGHTWSAGSVGGMGHCEAFAFGSVLPLGHGYDRFEQARWEILSGDCFPGRNIADISRPRSLCLNYVEFLETIHNWLKCFC